LTNNQIVDGTIFWADYYLVYSISGLRDGDYQLYAYNTETDQRIEIYKMDMFSQEAGRIEGIGYFSNKK